MLRAFTIVEEVEEGFQEEEKQEVPLRLKYQSNEIKSKKYDSKRSKLKDQNLKVKKVRFGGVQ